MMYGLRHTIKRPQRLVSLLNSVNNSSKCVFSTSVGETAPWKQAMPAEKFDLMKSILAAPSPIGLEGAMTNGVLGPEYESFMPSSWKIHRFVGSSSIVVDTAPDRTDLPSVMVVGHSDKIRMQVRHVASDGKVYVDSPSFLPLTLLGNEVNVFSEDSTSPGQYRQINGGTIEALGAIHFADNQFRAGSQGIKPSQLYLELHIHGDKKKQQVEEGLGIRAGDPILLDRPIKPGVGPDTFQGAYLDNGLGCFVTLELARLVAESQNKGELQNVRMLFTTAAFEEIGRFGSRVLASEFDPTILVAVDVNHDYVNAPNVGDKRFPELEMGKGFTISVGSITSPTVNSLLQQSATEMKIPYQMDCVGHDTGTDAMAGVLGSVDCAAVSLGIPVRNMHTVSECAHTGDVIACIHGVNSLVHELSKVEETQGVEKYLKEGHPNLSQASQAPDALKAWITSENGNED